MSISRQRINLIFFCATFIFLLHLNSNAQHLKLKLDKNGDTYIKAKLRTQLWTRYIDMNPGTTINGENVSDNIDFSLRRIRIGIDAQITKKLYIYMEIAGNNLNQKTSKNFSLEIFNLSAEYTFHKAFAIGFGKNAWQGFSRFNVFSSTSFLALDSPIFLLGTVNKNDHYGRSMGFWAKGQLGKLDYTFVLKQPDLYGEDAKENVVNYAKINPKMRTSAYIKYQFFDMESNKSGYSSGSYLGKKKVFNIGIGYMSQKKMMWTLVDNSIKYFDYGNFAFEIFFDSPLNATKSKSLTFFAGYFITDFGDNYVRNVGVNNYTSGGSSYNGAGHSFPMIGTGTSIFTEIGYMFPIFSNKKRKLQPYYCLQLSEYKDLKESVTVHDIGINIFFQGHLSKITLGYQNRPVFHKTNKSVEDRKSMFILQYQFVIN